MTGTLHEEQYTFLIISRSFLLRMRNVSDTFVAEIKTQNFMFCNFFFSKNVPFMRQRGKNIVEAGRPEMTIWGMRITWIAKAINKNSEYIILIVFPMQQWLHERTSILHYNVYLLSCFLLASILVALFIVAFYLFLCDKHTTFLHLSCASSVQSKSSTSFSV